jgi:hypothetical protein
MHLKCQKIITCSSKSPSDVHPPSGVFMMGWSGAPFHPFSKDHPIWWNHPFFWANIFEKQILLVIFLYFSTFLLVKSEITMLSHHFMRSWTLWPTVNSGPKPCFYWRRPIRGVCDPATVDFQLLAIYGYMEGASWAKNWLMGNGMNEPRIGVCTKQYVTRWDKIFMAQFGSG